mmetsp:Transcript_35616/g.81522  ORF Transcript_35616/g.81522 Transcript_35616/m.81522 type:complete len:252 (-) Transcript_35616:668-1423(-)
MSHSTALPCFHRSSDRVAEPWPIGCSTTGTSLASAMSLSSVAEPWPTACSATGTSLASTMSLSSVAEPWPIGCSPPGALLASTTSHASALRSRSTLSEGTFPCSCALVSDPSRPASSSSLLPSSIPLTATPFSAPILPTTSSKLPSAMSITSLDSLDVLPSLIIPFVSARISAQPSELLSCEVRHMIVLSSSATVAVAPTAATAAARDSVRSLSAAACPWSRPSAAASNQIASIAICTNMLTARDVQACGV